jgi:hypothetical protein
MSDIYSITFWLRNFGYSTYQVTNADDALHAMNVLVDMFENKERVHIKDFKIREVKIVHKIDTDWPWIDAAQEQANA